MPSLATWGGWRAALGCTPRSLATYRIALGLLLLTELLLRFRYLHAFYSDEGTFPLRLLTPQIDPVYATICVHCHSGALFYQQLLLSLQCVAAFFLTVGYKTKAVSIVSWLLYLSLTLRNTWLAFILDRYFHYLLFYAMLLPLGKAWSVDDWLLRKKRGGTTKSGGSSEDEEDSSIILSPATIALKLQIAWIYLDAGAGKYLDPFGGWTFSADPLPALDTYARHTVGARYLYALLGPFGLRMLTPTVVWVELASAPLALLGSSLGNSTAVWIVVGMVWSLHLGIAGTVRNTVLLSLVANVAWCVYLPLFAPPSQSSPPTEEDRRKEALRASNPQSGTTAPSKGLGRRHIPSLVVIGAFVAGSIWFEVLSGECDQSMKHVWSTLLHNRWNVFVGAEEYVTWEIAPGRLADNTIVDVWSKSLSINWDMPTGGTPCTSTARHGRWRSFPYLAELDGEAGEVLWEYLCTEWDAEHGVGVVDNVNGGGGNGTTTSFNGGKRLLRYNFFMLQADVLPEMGFSATRKRLIHAHECGGGGGSTGGGGGGQSSSADEDGGSHDGEL